jgi:selenocysteine lyase/cysteine desulfurase
VAVTGASNAIGTMPDISAITRQAHAAGAKVMVDGVHLTPHAPVGIAAIGCDIYSTSSYKWYGPHAGITWIEPGLRHGLVPYKVRPADDDHVDRFQLGTPAYETIAAIDAAAHFLLDTGMDSIAAHEREVFGVLLDGLLSLPGVEVLGPYSLEQRAPTLAFTMSGRTDNEIAIALADARVAVWDGHYYAIEVMAAYGIEGAVRAGIAAYVSLDDVYRLLDVVSSL